MAADAGSEKDAAPTPASEGAAGGKPPSQNETNSAGGGWRDAKRFNRGERYDSEARSESNSSPGAAAPRSPARDPRLRRLLIAGAAMIATTFLLRLFDLSGFLAFLVGLAVFAAILILGGRSPGAAAAPRRKVLAKPGIDAPRVQADLDKAEAEIAAMEALAPRFERPAVAEAIGRFATAARGVLDEIARDPNDADRARKFLVVILPSARRSTEKFLATGVRDNELDGRFESLLGALEAAAERQLETLRRDEKLDLEVEMEVLADRLRAET